MLIYLQLIETEEDKSKFVAIYQEYRGLMFHIAYSRLNNTEDAEDAVHHVFVKIAENIKLIDPVGQRTKRLVSTMVDNRVTDLFRVRNSNPTVPWDERVCAVIPEIEAEDLLTQCMLDLPENYRMVLWMKYQQGYTLKETAKLLGISFAHVQKINQRGKKMLADLYQERGGNL